MKDFSFPKQKISSIVILQRLIKDKIYLKNFINLELNNQYNIIYGVMKRIHSNFLLGIINQYDYNSYMNNLDDILNDFKKIDRPLTFKNIGLKNRTTIYSILEKVRNNLIELCNKCGTKSLFDGIKLVLGSIDKRFLNSFSYEEKNLLYFYQKVFIPTTLDYYNLNNNDSSTINEIIVFNKKLEKESNDFKNINQIDGITCFNMEKKNKSFIEEIQGARLYIPIKYEDSNLYFVFDGYFYEDPLNLSRIGGIFQKKSENLNEKIEDLKLNEYFKKAYIQQISLRDFIVLKEDEMIQKCSLAYEELQDLKNKTISSLVKEFLGKEISKQRDILTLFLLMKDDIDTQYLAYLMYDMISNESYLLKPQPLAEQVYNSLHWSVQKLFKVAIKKVNNDISNLLNFNEEDISYEKRIMLMKTSENVKSKAMDKFKEYTKSGESSAKSLQYLDGILKIPFSIYKKEKILSFLEDFKKILKKYIITNKISNSNKKIFEDFKNLETITSNDIDYLFNNINSLEENVKIEINDVIRILKKFKKHELFELIKLINDDVEDDHKINENQKKKELLNSV